MLLHAERAIAAASRTAPEICFIAFYLPPFNPILGRVPKPIRRFDNGFHLTIKSRE